MPREADPIARARARKQSQALMLAISAGAVVVVIIGVALGVYLTSGGGLSGPAKGGLRAVVGGEDASKWNHAELLEHINSRIEGEKLKQKPGRGAYPTAFFMKESADTIAFSWPPNPDVGLAIIAVPCIMVEKFDDVQKAKDEVGVRPDRSWNYGIWVFTCGDGQPEDLNRIKKALK